MPINSETLEAREWKRKERERESEVVKKMRSLRRFFFSFDPKSETSKKICVACHQISKSLTSFSTRNPILQNDYLKEERIDRKLWSVVMLELYSNS